MKRSVQAPVKSRLTIQIVDDASATVGLANEPLIEMAGCDHVTICCFDSPESERYLDVLDRLRIVCDNGKFETQLFETNVTDF